MTWRVVAALACGCELITLQEQSARAVNVGNAGSSSASVRSCGRCIYHLCRKCGQIPLADSEPDRLCNDCYEELN